MKIGDYVRTNFRDEHIIARIVDIHKHIDGSNWLELDEYTKYAYFDDKPENFKSSPNIIDLIEVGDYVNGYKVDDITDRLIYCCEDKYEDYCIKFDKQDIESIVTKEQFEAMEYKLEDK